MNEISKLQVHNGQIVNLKDSIARTSILNIFNTINTNNLADNTTIVWDSSKERFISKTIEESLNDKDFDEIFAI